MKLLLLLLLLQSMAAFEAQHSALAWVYNQQCTAFLATAGVAAEEAAGLHKALLDDRVYLAAHRTVKAELSAKGERSTTVDPQHGTIQDTYTPDEYVLIMSTIMAAGTPESDRSLAMGGTPGGRQQASLRCGGHAPPRRLLCTTTSCCRICQAR
jgi:hypothetical protein